MVEERQRRHHRTTTRHKVLHPCRGASSFFFRPYDRWCRFAQPPATRFDASGLILLRDVSFLTATSIRITCVARNLNVPCTCFMTCPSLLQSIKPVSSVLPSCRRTPYGPRYDTAQKSAPIRKPRIIRSPIMPRNTLRPTLRYGPEIRSNL